MKQKILKPKPLRDYREILLERLKDEEYALMYLNEALKDEDHQVFLLALKDVIESQGHSRGKALASK